MNSRPYPLNHIVSFAIVALLSACGGGGTNERPSALVSEVAGSSAPAPAGAPSRPPPASDSPADGSAAILASVPSFPPAATDAAQYPWDEMTGTYTLVPAAPSVDTGAEPPYPDLRALPTRIMAFEPVVFGDVAGITVTPAG